MTTPARRRIHETWLRELTMLPTAAGREDHVIEWVEAWVERRRDLRLRRDRSGNLLITRRTPRRGRPIFVTAHLDHPAFVVRRRLDARTLELEFRGGVHDPYFENAAIEVFDAAGGVHRGRVVELAPAAQPFKRVTAWLVRGTDAVAKDDLGRWAQRGPLPSVRNGQLYTHACDDLAGVAAALAALDLLRSRRTAPPVGVFLTRAEEVGFVGALAACLDRSLPRTARLICLENSRSFPDSPIGGGAILRVGDRLSVFDPKLTNRIGEILTAHAAKHPDFRWQRKLMPGGACEATAFSTYGWESTCVCLPLGNYHNMADIDGVLAGRRPARVGPEHIALADYHGMIEMLVVAATRLDSDRLPSLARSLEQRLERTRHVLE